MPPRSRPLSAATSAADEPATAARSRLIYDVGMNNGDDTAYYLHAGFRVVAIEADPTLVDAARLRFARELADGRLVLLNVAIGPEEGVRPFWICEGKREWNSFDRDTASRLGHPHHAVDVQCTRFGSLLRRYGVPHYLKIDIEGHDRYCVEDLDRHHLPKYISLELTELDDLVALKTLGYDGFKIITQNDFSRLRVPPPSIRTHIKSRLQDRPGLLRLAHRAGRLRGHIIRTSQGTSGPRQGRVQDGWSFPFGSSGPFGEDTEGPWSNFDEAAYAWLHYRLGLSEYGDANLGVWHDVHATTLDR